MILQGCQKPVTLFVHLGGRSLLVKNGQRIKLRKTVFIDPQITKEGNVVHITVSTSTQALLAWTFKHGLTQGFATRLLRYIDN